MNAIFLPQFDPNLIAFEIGGFDFAIRWYALSYIAGFLVAWRWFIVLAKRNDIWPNEVPPMTPEMPERLLTWIIIGILAGGRLGYVLFYNPGHFLNNPAEIFAIWQGGMSFHGGFAGLIVATWLFCRLNRLALATVSDAVALVSVPGLFFGRIANFINGELWGRPSDVPWSVVFPSGGGSVCPPDWTGICSRHPSQLYEALLEGVLICILLGWLVYRKKWMHRPGGVAGMFFAGYGAARVFVELFREPDSQFVSAENPHGFVLQFSETFGLTMGQSLTAPMLVIGAVVIWQARWKQRWVP